MGKSAKFYKRPSKKEKEGLAIKKIVEPSISKKNTSKSKLNVPASVFEDKKQPVKKTEEDSMEVDEVKQVKEQKPEKEQELPDYVDLFSGKKTYKKLPLKRK